MARQGKVLRVPGIRVRSTSNASSRVTIHQVRFGSITKTLTAAAVVLLAEQGQLALTDPVSAHLTEFGSEDDITIVNLLEHSSGLRDYYSWAMYRTGRTKPISPEAFLAQALAEPLDFAPGSQSAYSNTGYFVLAAIVERVSGLPFDEFIRRYLFEPLGMKRIGSFEDGRTVDGLATGYDPGFPPGYLQPASFGEHATWLAGSGSVYSTAPDMHRWLSAIRDHSLLDPDSLPYPYGWAVHTRLGRDVLEQNGRIPTGYASYVGLYPAEDVVVVVLSTSRWKSPSRWESTSRPLHWVSPTRSRAFDRALPDRIPRCCGRSKGAMKSRPASTSPCAQSRRGCSWPVRTERFCHWTTKAGITLLRPLWVPVSFVRDSTGRTSWLDWNGQFKAERTSSSTSGSAARCLPL